ncbi:MAG: outer membrane beta-barrel protein [Ignavibacteria bacterium]|nr:outer membrane beta-barrel protein [Ignavibacteria bacterium]
MKKNVILVLFFVFFILNHIYSKNIGFGFSVGLATPNSQINNVYNSDKISLNNKFWDVIRQGAKNGYFLGVNLNLPLSNNLDFKGGLSLNRFPQTELRLFFPEQPYDTVVLKTIQNFIPISAGFDLFLLKSFVSPYISGNLSYFYLVNTIDIVKLNQELPIATSKTESRIGAGLGAGLDFDFEIVTLNIEAKYWFVNLIGNVTNESNKNYFTLGVGITFGGK